MNRAALLDETTCIEQPAAGLPLPKPADFWELEALVDGGLPVAEALASMASRRDRLEGGHDGLRPHADTAV